MKGSREVDYYICDSCNKEMVARGVCSVCGIDLCRGCFSSPDVGSYTLCNECNTDEVKDVIKRFQDEWTILMEKQDKRCSACFEKYESELKEVLQPSS